MYTIIMVKVQKTTTTLPIFTVTTVSILIAGLLTILSVNIIPMQQAIAQVGSSANPNPNPQGQGSSLQGNPIGSSPQGSGPNQGAGGGGNPIGSTQGNPLVLVHKLLNNKAQKFNSNLQMLVVVVFLASLVLMHHKDVVFADK